MVEEVTNTLEPTGWLRPLLHQRRKRDGAQGRHLYCRHVLHGHGRCPHLRCNRVVVNVSLLLWFNAAAGN